MATDFHSNPALMTQPTPPADALLSGVILGLQSKPHKSFDNPSRPNGHLSPPQAVGVSDKKRKYSHPSPNSFTVAPLKDSSHRSSSDVGPSTLDVALGSPPLSGTSTNMPPSSDVSPALSSAPTVTAQTPCSVSTSPPVEAVRPAAAPSTATHDPTRTFADHASASTATHAPSPWLCERTGDAELVLEWPQSDEDECGGDSRQSTRTSNSGLSRPSTGSARARQKAWSPSVQDPFSWEVDAFGSPQADADLDPSHFQMGDIIATGAFGSVRLGLNLHTGVLMAVKHVRGCSAQQVKAIETEITMLKSLSHPNIVKYYGVCDASSAVFSDASSSPASPLSAGSNSGPLMFLEYVAGGSLLSMVANFSRLAESTAAIYTWQLLQGLHYLHSNGIIHRDIKLGNILVTVEGRVKLADFGGAKLQQEEAQNISLVGTPSNMAPEVIRQEGHNTKADIWGLGCCVVEMLSGRSPWQWDNDVAGMWAIGTGTAVPNIPTFVSQQAQDFCALCFCRDPLQRPSAAQLLEHDWVKNISFVPKPQPSPSSPRLETAATMATPGLWSFNAGGAKTARNCTGSPKCSSAGTPKGGRGAKAAAGCQQGRRWSASSSHTHVRFGDTRFGDTRFGDEAPQNSPRCPSEQPTVYSGEATPPRPAGEALASVVAAADEAWHASPPPPPPPHCEPLQLALVYPATTTARLSPIHAPRTPPDLPSPCCPPTSAASAALSPVWSWAAAPPASASDARRPAVGVLVERLPSMEDISDGTDAQQAQAWCNTRRSVFLTVIAVCVIFLAGALVVICAPRIGS